MVSDPAAMMAVVRFGRIPVLLTAVVLLAAACRSPAVPAGSGRFPPPPTTPRQSLGPTTPPVSWLSGTLLDATTGSFQLEQGDGAMVTLQRVGATKLFRVSGSSWEQLAAEAGVRTGEAACIETLLDGSNLVALRVFLGAGCGPI
jgi:hypothetical protein